MGKPPGSTWLLSSEKIFNSDFGITRPLGGESGDKVFDLLTSKSTPKTMVLAPKVAMNEGIFTIVVKNALNNPTIAAPQSARSIDCQRSQPHTIQATPLSIDESP
jgi:hypothetical protein